MKKAAQYARPFCLHMSIVGTEPKIAAVEVRAALISCVTPSLARGAQIVGGGFAGTAIGDDFVADLLAFTQRSKASAFDGADVHEYVVATVIRLDKAVALGRVKPLYGSHAHGIVPSQDRYNEAYFRRQVRSNFGRVVSA
jgi:hypothetical protein